MMRLIVSAELGFVGDNSALEPESEGGGVRTETSLDIDGFSKRVLMVIGRERRVDREVRNDNAVSELMPRSYRVV